jgi:ribosomal protein S18 acetylase RimI-like enzyme
MRLRRYAGIGDNPAITRLRQAIRDHDGDVWLPGPDSGEVPAEAFWLAEEDDTVVGITGVVHWTEDDGTNVFLITGGVHPARRGRGHGTAMLQQQEAYVTSLDQAAAGAALAGNADEGQPDAQRLMVDNGYRPAFTVVQLTRPITVADGDEIPRLGSGLRICPVAQGHLPRIYATVERCFRGSGHGFVPLDYPAYLAAVQDTDLWIVAWHGDEVIGVVINERQTDGSVDSPWVAVQPAYRRRGLATALLKHSFALMHRRGITGVTIRTVAENEHNSVGLYEKLGYHVVRRMPRFRKPLGHTAWAQPP